MHIRDLVESILEVDHSNINIVAYVEYFTKNRIYLKKCKKRKKKNFQNVISTTLINIQTASKGIVFMFESLLIVYIYSNESPVGGQLDHESIIYTECTVATLTWLISYIIDCYCF